MKFFGDVNLFKCMNFGWESWIVYYKTNGHLMLVNNISIVCSMAYTDCNINFWNNWVSLFIAINRLNLKNDIVYIRVRCWNFAACMFDIEKMENVGDAWLSTFWRLHDFYRNMAKWSWSLKYNSITYIWRNKNIAH